VIAVVFRMDTPWTILYGYCLCIVDPEGDYTSLEALLGVTVFGGVDPLPHPSCSISN
jgi:hypothetical protein